MKKRAVITLGLIGAVACNMAEMGAASREWERQSMGYTYRHEAAQATVYITGAAPSAPFSTSSCTGWPAAATGTLISSSAPDDVPNAAARDLRAKAERFQKRAALIEQRQKAERRWRDAVRACFP